MTARSLVTTKLGPVVGEQIISSGCSKPVHRFLGIPYAKAPVGQFRFRRPVPLDTPWSEPLQATQWPPQCPQFSATPFNKACEPYFKNSTHSEDCLKLNIWSPDVSGVFSAAEEGSLKRPVLVWIHGGGLVAGTASFDLYDGELFASEHDLVFVSFNYRLGTLGFFTAKSVPDINGNQGLFDQVAALQWVQENIRCFGGDPNKVTIMGQSAGSWSVSLHILSPLSRNLFQNAILMSGAATNLAVSPEVQIEHYLSALKKMGIANKDDENISAETVEKLMQLDADKLSTIYYQMDRRNAMDRKSVVVIDGEFLPNSVDHLLSTGQFKQELNLLSSIVEDEGSFYLTYTPYPFFKKQNPDPISYNEAKEFLRKLIVEFKPFESLSVCTEKVPIDLLLDFYFRGLDPNGNDQNQYRKRIGIALGDLWLACPTLNFSKEVFKRSNGQTKVYQWFYTAKSDNVKLLSPEWGGVAHCDDLFPLFGMPHRYPKLYSNQDRLLSTNMMNFVSQFVKTGNPGPEWKSYFSFDNNLMAPFYKVNNEENNFDQFKFNCKQIECEFIWGKVKQYN
ncbi:hypothetical protein TYRP_017664 [Tyrophagus putrescentiae]|nr:hypothetical protein TYRP_017664 [Tyrophagus putrescentiae]